MTTEFFQLTPIILNDDVYTQFGGRTGTSTPVQRQAAYAVAEEQMVQHLTTPLIPTTMTGSFQVGQIKPSGVEVLPHSYVRSIDDVTFINWDGSNTCSLDETSGCAFIHDSTFGVVNFLMATSLCVRCTSGNLIPHLVRVTYTAGLSNAVATGSAALQQALTMVADSFLMDVIDPAANEGGAGDMGVQEYVNMAYGEKRFPLIDTTFGSSAKMNRVAKLVAKYRKKRALGFGSGRWH